MCGSNVKQQQTFPTMKTAKTTTTNNESTSTATESATLNLSSVSAQHPVSPHSPESSLPPVTPTRQPLLDISNTQPTMAPSTLQVFPASTPSFFASQTQESSLPNALGRIKKERISEGKSCVFKIDESL